MKSEKLEVVQGMRFGSKRAFRCSPSGEMRATRWRSGTLRER